MTAPNPKDHGPARCAACGEPFAPGALCTEGGRCSTEEHPPPAPSAAELALRLEARALDLERAAVNVKGIAVALRIELDAVRRGERTMAEVEGLPVYGEARRWA